MDVSVASDVEELLTIAEVAKLLKVSVVTLHRWLKQGRLPAYKLGPRCVRIRRSDLGKVLTATPGEADTAGEEMSAGTGGGFRRLTDEEVERRLAAIKEAQALRGRMLAERGGKPFSPSWPLIRRAREERSKQL